MRVNRIISFIHEYLFPARCAICQTVLLDIDEAVFGLCADCASLFAIPTQKRCALCGRFLASEQTYCAECRNEKTPHSFDRVICLYPYTGRYRQLLTAYKFGEKVAVGNFLAQKIIEASALFPEPLAKPFLVPVPPRQGKIKGCGWDQVEYLAHSLERERRYGAAAVPPVKRCLKRLLSQTQKHLNSRQRKANLAGRILCTAAAPQQAILFDDVYTTGSTMESCAAALKKGGADQVYGICLFHTELKENT
ncbi:MAG: double zinc ribbon domain-containing protein [Spirochaetaceae bacterium]|jgi:ComF family protein|nr:double zinc ribbon domain-containing protein [Spirochaetaceae bacterium]